MSKTLIPKGLAPYFQEYDLKSLKVERDFTLIIQRTLEYGTWDEVRWLFEVYGARRIRAFVRAHGERMLPSVTFNYWRKLLEIKRWRHSPFSITKGELWNR